MKCVICTFLRKVVVDLFGFLLGGVAIAFVFGGLIFGGTFLVTFGIWAFMDKPVSFIIDLYPLVTVVCIALAGLWVLIENTIEATQERWKKAKDECKPEWRNMDQFDR